MPATNTVLVAVDGSEVSERAFEWFATHMYKSDQEVILLHVAIPPSLHGYAAMGAPCSMPVDEMSRSIHEHVRAIKQLEDYFEDRMREYSVKGRVVALGHHDPNDAIVRYSEDHNIDMVVLGSRGHGKLRQTIMGSVSAYCLHHCTMPVVIIPPDTKF